MSVIYGIDKMPQDAPESAVAVGVFDGVHWGHRAVFSRLMQTAAESGLTSVALTFDKHPAELLAPMRAPAYINTLEQRIELIAATGVEDIVVAEFDPELAGLTRDEFLQEVLRRKLRCRHIVVGSNFRFGRNREGDIRHLEAAAPALGIQVTTVPAVIIDGAPVNSTRIRAQIERGDVEAAARLLGRRFVLRGVVVTGRKLGRSLGFPTANLQTGPRQLLPAKGVYVVQVELAGAVRTAVSNVGVRPTFEGGGVSVEVHVPGFEGDIYGQTLDVVFCRRLRDEMTFEAPEKLAEQIRLDLERAAHGCESSPRQVD